MQLENSKVQGNEDLNAFALLMSSLGIPHKLEQLQGNKSEEVSDRAIYLLDTYFGE